jgi:hypothetical protein
MILSANVFPFIYFIPIILISLSLSVLMIASKWIIYNKAGKPGWAAIIPIYNTIVLLEIVKKPWWWIFLLLIPLVNIVFIIIIYNNLAKVFGKDVGYTIGLLLLGFIFFPLLAFGNSKYIWNEETPSAN